MANRASINTDLELDIDIDFERAVPGSNVSDECIQEFADRLRISAKVPDILSQEPCLSEDADNILVQDADGCFRVPGDLFCRECITVPRPDPVSGVSGEFLIPITAMCISSIILDNGMVIDVPDSGLTGGEEPADLQEFVDNLNGEQSDITFSVEGSSLVAVSNLGEAIKSVIQCDPEGAVSSIEVTAIPLDSEEAGDSVVVFTECASSRGIDYTSVGMLFQDVQPANGFDRIVRTRLRSDLVEYRIEKQTTDVEFCLAVFTPTSPENAQEF